MGKAKLNDLPRSAARNSTGPRTRQIAERWSSFINSIAPVFFRCRPLLVNFNNFQSVRMLPPR